jgi:hypothetical protein
MAQPESPDPPTSLRGAREQNTRQPRDVGAAKVASPEHALRFSHVFRSIKVQAIT